MKTLTNHIFCIIIIILLTTVNGQFGASEPACDVQGRCPYGSLIAFNFEFDEERYGETLNYLSLFSGRGQIVSGAIHK